jgi:hypothetical protein
MDVVARYEERRFDGRRIFELFPDRVVVKGTNSLAAEFESTVMLATLQPLASKIRMRPKGFFQGIFMTIIAVALIQSGFFSLQSYWGMVDFVMIIAGILLALATSRKIDWVQFQTKAGTVALTVARVGKQESEFEPFVQALIRQIQAAG